MRRTRPAEAPAPDAIYAHATWRLIAPAATGYGSAHDLAHPWPWWTGDGGGERPGNDLRTTSLSSVSVGHDHVLGRKVAWGLGPQVDDDSSGMGGVGGCFGAHLLQPELAFAPPPPGQADLLDDALDALAATRT